MFLIRDDETSFERISFLKKKSRLSARGVGYKAVFFRDVNLFVQHSRKATLLGNFRRGMKCLAVKKHGSLS